MINATFFFLSPPHLLPMVSNSAILLLLLTAVLLTCAGYNASATLCPNCGTTPVPYPLSTRPTCGDPNYKIRCQSGSLLFDTLNNTYTITSISPQTQRFAIRPAPFINARTCITTDLPTQGVQLNRSLPFNITSSNTIMYLNCPENLLQSPLNCSSTSLCHSYINNSGKASACGEKSSNICCTFRAGGSPTSYSLGVVSEVGCRAYTSFVNLNYSSPVSMWPAPELEIEWLSPPEPLCETQADCDSNSTCGASQQFGNGERRCLCNSGFHWNPIAGLCDADETCGNGKDCSTDRTALIAGLTTGVGTALFAATIGLLLFKRQQHIKEEQERLKREREEILNLGGKGKYAKYFTGKEIKKATNNFSTEFLLGSGGFGEVYKGILDDDTVVAVKCAKFGNAKGTDQVLNEVRILCQVNHKNLVNILGCCVELEQPLVVYEYISNGTLLDHLRGESQDHLTWKQRLDIAHGTAEGLAYLHFSGVSPIYHRDVKSSNILLDDNMNAKVGDFGLSRLVHTDTSHVSTCAQGTIGYLDPEYYRNYQLTDKSDVYSFGVVLAELLTSQKAIDFDRPSEDINLAVYMRGMVKQDMLMDTIDPILKEGASELEFETMKLLCSLAICCLEEQRQQRPSMKEVAEEIEYIISILSANLPE